MDALRAYLINDIVNIVRDYNMITEEEVKLNKYWIDYEFLLNVKILDIWKNKISPAELDYAYSLSNVIRNKFFLSVSPQRLTDYTDTGEFAIRLICSDLDITPEEFLCSF